MGNLDAEFLNRYAEAMARTNPWVIAIEQAQRHIQSYALARAKYLEAKIAAEDNRMRLEEIRRIIGQSEKAVND